MKWVLDMLNCKNVLCEKISESIFQMMDTVDTMCIYIMLQNVNSTEETRRNKKSIWECCKQFAVCIHYLSNIDADADIQCR